MTRQERADRIGAQLDALYPEAKINAPLDYQDAYTLLVAVLLSAQTTDARVNMVTPGLYAQADNPADMVALGEQRVLEAIKTCGLAPTKARNIVALSQQLLDRHDGAVPDTLPELEALPGVGHKTASVVISQWFGVPAFPVDTHIHRLAHRWQLTRGTTVEHTERDLKKVFARDTWNRRHLQIIFFGREHCPARGHDLSACPICSWAATKKRIREESG